ncbi:MAG: hypothetical protein NC084_08790 [Bacteroides sp.]|nr:hypothetical protein [Eubacterium sp.]MCM1418725.1 hypothetical protein [Roseburia sp.]MCM1462792.1 hypothetical protein [Bacteroides sp.]
MKRKKIISTLLAAALFLSGCKGSGATDQSFDEESFLLAMSGTADRFSYDEVASVSDYDVGDDGTLYALQSFYEEDGSTRTELHCYAPDGHETKSLGAIRASAVLWGGDTLYLAIGREEGGSSLTAYDLESGETTKLADTVILPQNAVLIGDTIYYTGITEDRYGMRERIGNSDFEYDGTLLYSYRLGDETEKLVDVEYPVAIAKTVSGELCVYAADESGPYFTIGVGGKKIYNDLGQVDSFGFVNENNFVFHSDVNPISLNMGRLDSNSIYSELIESAAAYRIKVRSAYVYYINGFTQKLERINSASFDKQNEIIRFLSPEYTFDKPFSIGYMTDYHELDDESFSLAVLSQDNSYDLFMVNSYDGFSSNIRDKGSFYPLNDVPNVLEYLDRCFPYLKDAATDAEGNIWMLPINIDLPVIVYNKEACDATGIDFGGELTVDGFTSICERAYLSDYKNGYDIHPYPFTKYLLTRYMAFHDSFDTPELRDFAAFAKEKINLSEFPPYFPLVNAAMNNLYMPGSEKDVLFSYLSDLDKVEWLSSFDGFDFCAVPAIDPSTKPVATCAFLTVNSASSNLEATLSYVSDLAAHLGESQNSFLLADKSTYTANKAIESVYDLASAAEIGFNISDEIYFALYREYHAGALTLDEFIAEADRKLTAYLNE